MLTFLTFEVSQTADKPREGEPLWRQVDWRVIAEADNPYERDAAERFADSGDARTGVLYATIVINRSVNKLSTTLVHYWTLTQVTKEVDPADWFADDNFLDLSAVEDAEYVEANVFGESPDQKTTAMNQTHRESRA